MSDPTVERIFSGFCRTFNQTQTVTCEFEQNNGKAELIEADCAYTRCEHKASCEIAKSIREAEEQFGNKAGAEKE